MNTMEDAALEAVRRQQRTENQNETSKKYQTTFNLRDSIKQVIKVMKDEQADEDRHIPPKLFRFVTDADTAPKYEAFLQTLLEYCKELFRLENKQKVLEEEARQRNLPVPQVLPSEKKKLNEKATKMANSYSWIIYLNASLSATAFKNNKSYIQFKSKIESNKRPDINFFETLTIFSAKVLKEAFDSAELMKLEEEINRLFRTNAFNITERKLHKESLERQYPQLRDLQMPAGTSSELSNEIQNRLIQRSKVPKDAKRMKFNRQKSEIRPFYQKMNTSSALNSRSPMVSLIFPSLKDKIKMFEEQSKKKESQRAASSVYVKRRELEKMVETETRKRNASHWNI